MTNVFLFVGFWFIAGAVLMLIYNALKWVARRRTE